MKLWTFFQPISFQAIWLLGVLGGNLWLPIAIAIILLHFYLTPSRKSDLKILPLALIGFSVDMTLTYTGVFLFNEWPAWLLVLWLGFVLNFGHSLRFLRKLKLVWLLLIGAIGGTYSYWISMKLGAVAWPLELQSTLIIVSFYWAIMLVLLVKIDIYIRSKFVE